ncbi:MAG: site-2 protease family protein [Clostridiales bacterium]|nr:site-2 protease family protein [Clostridiales bacterium]
MAAELATWFLAGFCVSLFHELGHATAARFLRWPFALIRIGVGPLLFRLGALEIRVLPFGGVIRMPEPPRATATIILWGGLLTSAFTGTAFTLAFFLTGQQFLFLFAVAVLSIVGFVFNLDPGIPGSDGHHLFGPRPKARAWARQGVFLLILITIAAIYKP